ncbi:unnamed protein product, partial [Effrenium voratum]
AVGQRLRAAARAAPAARLEGVDLHTSSEHSAGPALEAVLRHPGFGEAGLEPVARRCRAAADTEAAAEGADVRPLRKGPEAVVPCSPWRAACRAEGAAPGLARGLRVAELDKGRRAPRGVGGAARGRGDGGCGPKLPAALGCQVTTSGVRQGAGKGHLQ